MNRFNCTPTLHNWWRIPLNPESKWFAVHLRHFSWNFHPCRQCKHVYRSAWISGKAQTRNWSASRFPLSSKFFLLFLLVYALPTQIDEYFMLFSAFQNDKLLFLFLCNFESRHVIATLINNFIFTKMSKSLRRNKTRE